MAEKHTVYLFRSLAPQPPPPPPQEVSSHCLPNGIHDLCDHMAHWHNFYCSFHKLPHRGGEHQPWERVIEQDGVHWHRSVDGQMFLNIIVPKTLSCPLDAQHVLCCQTETHKVLMLPQCGSHDLNKETILYTHFHFPMTTADKRSAVMEVWQKHLNRNRLNGHFS